MPNEMRKLPPKFIDLEPQKYTVSRGIRPFRGVLCRHGARCRARDRPPVHTLERRKDGEIAQFESKKQNVACAPRCYAGG